MSLLDQLKKMSSAGESISAPVALKLRGDTAHLALRNMSADLHRICDYVDDLLRQIDKLNESLGIQTPPEVALQDVVKTMRESGGYAGLSDEQILSMLGAGGGI